MEKIFKDLVIIGAGPGGTDLAIEASKLGLDVAIFEKDNLGGTCLNQGCIPTKTYFQYAKVKEQTKKLFNQEINVDFKQIFESKNNTIDLLKNGLLSSLSKTLIINEAAKLVKDNEKIIIKSDNYLIEAKYIVIATGSVDARLNIEGIGLAINAKELLDLNYLPSSISIIGGGVIGAEMASIYNALGVKVNIFEYFPQILPRFDKEISRRLSNLLKTKGINIYNNANVYKLEKDVNGIKINAKILDKEINEVSDIVLSATGRYPNIDNIGLDEVGIEYKKYGIIVNDNLQTSIPNIYAIGDCIGGIMLAHKASYDAKLVLNHIMNNNININYDLIPACCFSLPEVANIGLNEDDVKEKGIEYKIIKELYRSNGKAQAIKETDGFIKIIISNDLIIGASIIGEEANLLIHEISTLMNAKIKISEAKNYIHAHPTLSEIIQSALNKL